MGPDPEHLYVVMMNVEADKEAAFNEVYDTEHIPALLQIPGVLSATRYQTSTAGIPKYAAVYALADPGVPERDAFKRAAESGTWPHAIRPYTKNRSHILYTHIAPRD